MPQEVTYLEFLSMYKYQRENVFFHSIFSGIFTITYKGDLQMGVHVNQFFLGVHVMLCWVKQM